MIGNRSNNNSILWNCLIVGDYVVYVKMYFLFQYLCIGNTFPKRELNKEHCHRGTVRIMTDAGRAVSPDMSEQEFVIDQMAQDRNG